MFSVHKYEVPLLPTVLDDLSCTGKETSLLDCCHIGGRHNCYYTIGIECAGNYRIIIESLDSIASNMPMSPWP